MNNTAVLNVKIDPIVKTKAHKIAGELGFSLSAVVNATLRELIRTKSLNVSAAEYIPSARLVASIKAADEDIKNGTAISFKSGKKALQYLDAMIAKKSK